MEVALFQSITTPAIAFVVCLLLRAIFSFLETSITALRLFKLKELASSTQNYASLFQALEKFPHRVLITILIANSLVDVTAAALATSVMELIFEHFHLSSGLGFSLGIGLATVAILIFGEIIPKNVARSQSEQLFRSTLWLTNIIFYVFHPVVSCLTYIADFLITRFSSRLSAEPSSDWVSSEREIQFLIRYIHEKGLMEEEKTEMLQNIFELGRTPVKDIIVPATDIVSIPVTLTIQQALAVFLEHHFSRFPVYQDYPENIIGMIHLKDICEVFARNKETTLVQLIRPILFVPETVKVNQLLREFRSQHMHIAMVLDEHGIITGLITLEDVLEEIVGDISDEHELEEQKIAPLKPGSWLVDAATTLEDLSELLHIQFQTEHTLTLGGFISEQLQHVPKKGERVIYKDYCFQVQKASPKRVLQVLIFKEKAKQSLVASAHDSSE